MAEVPLEFPCRYDDQPGRLTAFIGFKALWVPDDGSPSSVVNLSDAVAYHRLHQLNGHPIRLVDLPLE